MLSSFKNRIRLRHLHCLVAVAQAKHLGSAGERMGLTQPAVSKTLRELEELVGCQLLVRHRTGIELTASGARLLRHALRIVEEVEAVAGNICGTECSAVQSVRLGALPSVVPAFLADALTSFRVEHQNVGLAV